MTTHPVFGEKLADKNYQSRYAAYVVLADENRKEIVLVQAPNGAYFLPGGEIEAGETKETAIDREMIEELGVKVSLGTYFGQADEYFFSRHRDTYYYNPGYFYQVDTWEQICEPTEKTNQLLWTTPQKALELLKRGSHRWAVEEWLLKNK
ncbi:8-oxo-dGTP diphosphatase [Enterococcus sp. PF1-24]|uniref:NUDIX hydrolase n=1 Tax=unclassified Enterococcus TaxID=2608891 RepID=UPI002475D449|nr:MULTISPECIES: NUDIX hydrolase [unclassified Enterococcus]MDH6364772.1 8-oxo-dGTP diphosphatase [Enterococcus sp. PFB1-1]MDH6401883.1 8-oxo-dGTP diphosphatase [Enterococcus sp. PF1-24]